MIFKVLWHLDIIIFLCQLLYKESLGIKFEHGMSPKFYGKISPLLDTFPCFKIHKGKVKAILIFLYSSVFIHCKLDNEFLP